MRYQTHDPDEKGMSDSARKLARLHLPEDLSGKSVLDIGCSEGFFCHVAAQRGAAKVVGIDIIKSGLEFARERYSHPTIEFRHQSWKTLPDGPFDLVLWTSAMHYELNPKGVFDRVRQILKSDGKLVLECGIALGNTKEMVMTARPNDTLWYPTMRHLVENLLADFATRQVAWPEKTPGDPLPRIVLHAQRRLPTVLVFRGAGHYGKSASAAAVAASATQLISLDNWVATAKRAPHHQNEVQQFIRDKADPGKLDSFYEAIDAAGLTEEYATLLAKSVSESDRLVVFEGAMTDAQLAALTRMLSDKALVWDADRCFPSGGGNFPQP